MNLTIKFFIFDSIKPIFISSAMKRIILLLFSLSFVSVQFAQELSLSRDDDSFNRENRSVVNLHKTYGDVFWEEDFDSVKWRKTVLIDDLGFKLNSAATMPKGWKFVDNTQNDFFWHWSNVGPRGVYTSWEDNDSFTPNNELLDYLPQGTTVENGFMLLESDYFNTSASGNMVGDPIAMDSYFEFGPIDFSDKAGVMFNVKVMYLLCCSAESNVSLFVANNYKPDSGLGNWESYELCVRCNHSSFMPDSPYRDFHCNISLMAALHDSVYFRIAKKNASHYYVFIDDIKFYEPYSYNLVFEEGWADYMHDAEETEFLVYENDEAFNFWGGYTQIPKEVVGDFKKFRAAIENYGMKDALNSKLYVNIYKDDVLNYSDSSEAKTVYNFSHETFRIDADYTPEDVGVYQISMNVLHDKEDEVPEDNAWVYNFEVNNTGVYSRVRHGMEHEFDQAGNRDWAGGGLDGDICAHRFLIPQTATTAKLKGLSVYMDNYSNRDDEIEAIKKGEFQVRAKLFRAFKEDSLVELEIASELYTLKIKDTASWVGLDFINEGSLIVEPGLYYAGIEIFTGNEDLRFQIGEDIDAPKQPKNGGLVYLNNPENKKWYYTGQNYAIDLLLDNKVTLTFNANTFTCDYLVNGQPLYVTGDFNNWLEPGLEGSVLLTNEGNDDVYSGAIDVLSNIGEVDYQYYVGSGFDRGYWPEERSIHIAEENIVINDNLLCIGVNETSLDEIIIAPNPFSNSIVIDNLFNADRVIVRNVLGQCIINHKVENVRTRIGTAEFEKGIYFIIIEGKEGNVRTEKLLK